MGTKPHTATEEQLEDTLRGARKEVTGPGVHNPLFLETEDEFVQIYTITDEGWGWLPAFLIPKLLPSLCPGSPSVPTLHQILKALTLRTQTIPISTTWSNWIRNKQKTHPIILLLLLNSPIFLPFTSHLSEQDSWSKQAETRCKASVCPGGCRIFVALSD